MKLSYEDKVEIYHLRQSGCPWSEISDKYEVDKSGLKYMYRLMEKYGIDCVRKTNNRYYSPELKQEIIDQVLIEGRSQGEVSLDYALPTRSLLTNWIAKYKKNG